MSILKKQEHLSLMIILPKGDRSFTYRIKVRTIKIMGYGIAAVLVSIFLAVLILLKTRFEKRDYEKLKNKTLIQQKT